MLLRHFLSSRFLYPGLVLSIAAVSLSSSGCGLVGRTVGAGILTANAAATTAIAMAPLKLLFACLPEGTEIDTPSGKQAIETLKAGDLVIGYEGSPVKVLQIHGYLEDPENSKFHAITFSNGTTVDLCSMHRIEGLRAKGLVVGTVLPSGLSVVEHRTYEDVERSYDLLTEDAGYRVGGIPVNSLIEEMYETGRTGLVRR